MTGVLSYLQQLESDLKNELGVKSPQGPNGFFSQATFHDVERILSGHITLRENIRAVNPEYEKYVQVLSTVTDLLEHVWSKVRAAGQGKTDNPTVLQVLGHF